MLANADIRCHELLNAIYNEPKVGVEIGVFKGDLSWRLVASNRNLFLYMIDPWSSCEEGDSYINTDDYIARYSSDQHENAMQQAMNAVSQFHGQYKIMRMKSADAAPEFAEGSLDFVFIDGDHSYDGCSSDIAMWYPKLKKGGILSGHDYRNERNYGVIKAVDEFVHSTGHRLKLGANYTWFVTK